MSYAFRILFEFVQNGLEVEADELTLWETDDERVWLQAAGPLSDARRASLRGETYPTEEEADRAGERWMGVFILALTRGYVDVDFLERRSFTTWSDEALAVMQAAVGPDYLSINDRAGVLVHPADVTPISVGASATVRSRQPADYFLNKFRGSVDDASLRRRTTLAYQLYSARGRVPNDAQLLTLVSAVEALVVPEQVDVEDQALIDQLLRQVAGSDLPRDRRNALASRVSQLKNESIGRGGRRLAVRLIDREYDGMSPERFFARVYRLRSNMTHGAEPPALQEVGNVLPHLINFVRDLIELCIVEPTEE